MTGNRITSPKRLDVINPATGNVIDHVPLSSVSDVHNALIQASQHKAEWRGTRLADRQFVFNTFIEKLNTDSKKLAELLSTETGTPILQAKKELADAQRYFEDAIGESNAFYGTTYPAGAETISDSFLQYTTHESLGVIGVIMDEECPVLSFAYQVATGLILGNSLIVSLPPGAPLTVLKISDLLHASGIPYYALQTIVAEEATSSVIIQSPDINGLNIHSQNPDTGALISRARENLTRIVALGPSNDPLIVLPDADLELAVAESVRAGIDRAGQLRARPRRFFIHTDVFDSFLGGLLEKLKNLSFGDPLQEDTKLGPLINPDMANNALLGVQRAVERGSTLHLRGNSHGSFVEPIVLEVQQNDPLVRDEIMQGPIFVLFRFSSENASINLANSSPYGIAASVFTQSIDTAGRFTSALDFGTVTVNTAGDYRSRQLPRYGVRKSGIGEESLLSTAINSTELKTILAADVYEYISINDANVVGQHT